MLIADQLMFLARCYCDHEGCSLHALGARISPSKAKLFKSLSRGQSCYVESADEALLWLAENWPRDLAWPRSIAKPPALPSSALERGETVATEQGSVA
jgi:hypothetical protein